MTTLYKDFGKDSKDLIQKNVNSAGVWKIEQKAKARKGDYAVATNANSKGDISVDVEYASVAGGNVKISLTPKDLKDIKATLQAENYRGHKLEAIVSHKGDALKDWTVEVTQQTVQALVGNRVHVNSSLNAKAADVGVSVGLGRGVYVGGGCTLDRKSKTCAWTTGCRWVPATGSMVSLRMQGCQSILGDVMAPLKLHANFQPVVAVQAIYNTRSKSWTAVAGVETKCKSLLPNASVKARVNERLEWVVSYVAKLNGNWTLSVSLDKNRKTGLTLTQN